MDQSPSSNSRTSRCPFCGAYARNTLPEAQRTFVDSGRATYLGFALPVEMHPLAVKAGEAAECAARDGKYWPMHNRLFQEPVSLAVRDLIDAAHHVDLDTDRFQACLAGQARETVAADIALATRLHVDATPTFFIGTLNGSGVVTVTKRIDGAMPFDVLEQAIESVAHTVYQ